MLRPKVYRRDCCEWIVQNQTWDAESWTWTKPGKILAEFDCWEYAISHAQLVVVTH